MNNGLVTVELGAGFGGEFQEKWELAVTNAKQAINLIDANCGGNFLNWMRQNRNKYSHYHIAIEKNDGSYIELNDQTFKMDSRMTNIKSIRITPILQGSGGKMASWFQVIVAVVVIVVSCIWFNPAGIAAGVGMLVGGVMGLIAANTSDDNKGADNKNSNYFNGPKNTVAQGNPVQLIYGKKILVGSQIISSTLDIEQMINKDGTDQAVIV